MGRIVGIDLGTTYSAVAIPEERNEEGFFLIRTCPGVSIIQDRFKNRITPSVVAEDSRGEIIVGRAAKNRAGFSPEPIMFAKRSMGEDVTYQLDKQGTLTPVDVSAHILRYLKEIAEERLGEPVDEAVITVPAYFHLRAKQATEEAGVKAGLRVAQVAPEPVAAALMYCAGDDRDPLRVMTYDLGGGTFDVAVLEKRDQTITADSMLTVDGDRYLGGYNFDLLLTEWIQNQIRAKGYRLELSPSDPQTRITNAKLMLIAENLKVKLSDVAYFVFQEENLGIADDDGIPISLEGIEIQRSTFEAMISPMVEKSIDLCHRAMEKANPPILADSLNEILMVGGSSRIPMIGVRLEKEFGIKPKLVEPDLCVCLGAAILAGTQAKSVGRFKLNPIPKETDLPFISITGHALPVSAGENLAGMTVRLTSLDGAYNAKRDLQQDGSFVFDRVSLVLEAENSFTLTLYDSGGNDLDRHSFTILNTMEGGGEEQTYIPNVLTKPIMIRLADGMYTIAPERTTLAYNKQLTTLTSDTSGVVRIPIYEENNPLGEIVLTGLPKTLQVGSSVDVDITIQNDYKIIGKAQIKSLAQEAIVRIEIPVPPKKSLSELSQEYQTLQARAEEAIAAAPPGVRFGDARVRRLRDRLKEVEDALGRAPVEEAMVQDRLDEIESLIRDISAGWKAQPPKIIFDERVEETREALQRAIKQDDQVANDGYDRQIDAIVNEGVKAFQAQDSAKWRDAYENIEALFQRLDRLSRKKEETGGGGAPPQDPAQLLISLSNNLASLKKSAEQRGKYEQFKLDFETLAQKLKAIDPKSPDAMPQIYDWHFTFFEDLRTRMDVPEKELGLTTLPKNK